MKPESCSGWGTGTTTGCGLHSWFSSSTPSTRASRPDRPNRKGTGISLIFISFLKDFMEFTLDIIRLISGGIICWQQKSAQSQNNYYHPQNYLNIYHHHCIIIKTTSILLVITIDNCLIARQKLEDNRTELCKQLLVFTWRHGGHVGVLLTKEFWLFLLFATPT